jgi:hypothetical protein
MFYCTYQQLKNLHKRDICYVFSCVLCSTYIILHLFHVSLLVVFLLYVKSSALHILKFAYKSWRNKKKTCKNLFNHLACMHDVM